MATALPSSQAPTVAKPQWAPRVWEGCDFIAWMRLLIRNRFKVHWSCIYIALIVTCVSFGHTLLRWLQEAIYGRRIRRTTTDAGRDRQTLDQREAAPSQSVDSRGERIGCLEHEIVGMGSGLIGGWPAHRKAGRFVGS